MELLIPNEYKYHECEDVKYAYENGFYDGRDETIDTFIPVDDPTKYILDKRKEQGLTIEQFAEVLDTSKSTINNMVAGRIIGVDKWFSMIDKLGYDVWIQKKE